MKKIIILTFLLSGILINAWSQSTSQSQTISLTINNILELDFDNTTPNLGFTFDNATAFENGITNNSAAGFRVRSNKNWIVNVKANSANFAATVGGDANVNASTLYIRKNGTTNGFGLTTTDQPLANGNKGGFGANTFKIDYIANPGYISPATYSLNVTFTVTAP